MAVGAFRHFLPILGLEIPEHQVRAFRSGKIGKTVDPAMLTNPVSGVSRGKSASSRRTPTEWLAWW